MTWERTGARYLNLNINKNIIDRRKGNDNDGKWNSYYLCERGKMLLKWKLKYEDKYSKEF
jgi:hypothetical protein